MAITLLVHTIAGSTDANSVTTSGIDTTGATLLVAFVSTYEPNAAGTLSDSKGNTWTPLTAQAEATLVRGRMFYVANPTVGTGHTFTVSGTSDFPSVAAAAFSGVATTSPFDAENGNHISSGLTISTGSVTPAQNNELFITGVADGVQATGRTIDNSFTLIDENPGASGQCFGTGLAYLVQGSGSALNPQWTLAGSTTYAAATLSTFKEAGGGGGGQDTPELYQRHQAGQLLAV